MRCSNSDRRPAPLRLANPREQQFSQLSSVSRISRAGEYRRTKQFARKLGLPLALQLAITIILEKTRLVQRIEKVLLQIANLNLTGDSHQLRAQIKRRL